MCVATYAGDTLEGEVERGGSKSSTREERYQKRAKARVDVEWEPLPEGKARQGGYVVNNTVWKRWRGANKKDGVTIDQAGHRRNVGTVCRSRTGNEMDFDAEVRSSFAEGGMSGLRYDPGDRSVNVYGASPG